MSIKKTYTARELEISIKAGPQKGKKAYTCMEYVGAVSPLQGNSFSTGKHGRGKTRLMCADFFTGKKVNLLVDSCAQFVDLTDHVNYTEQLCLITTTDPKTFTVEVLDSEYNTLNYTCLEDEFENLKINEYAKVMKLKLNQVLYTKVVAADSR